MSQPDYKGFADNVLKVTFHDLQLLVTAFTHRSYLNEHRKSADEHNERLEFLGDAVLELVVTEFLYKNYDEPEGILTNWRSALVRTESLAAAGEKLAFDDYLRLSKGEKRGGERARQQIYANTFEAIIGAVYLDQNLGFEAARTIIAEQILSTLDGILESGSWRDSKSRLQEVAQSKDGYTPIYKVMSEEGPDHEKTFVIGVYISDKLLGKGSGPSKQVAQQGAAEAALEVYKS